MDELAALHVRGEDVVHKRVGPAASERRADDVRLIAQQLEVEHGGYLAVRDCVDRARRARRSASRRPTARG
jgi:hypothetical protein